MFRGYHYIYWEFNSSGIFYTVPCQCLELLCYDTCVYQHISSQQLQLLQFVLCNNLRLQLLQNRTSYFVFQVSGTVTIKI